MQKDPACRRRCACFRKASLVGNSNKLDFKKEQNSPLCTLLWGECEAPLTPDSAEVFKFHEQLGIMGSPCPQSRCASIAVFPHLQVRGQACPAQPHTFVQEAAHNARHRGKRHSQHPTCTEWPPHHYSTIRNTSSQEAGTKYPCHPGLWHSWRTLLRCCWVSVVVFSEKNSARKSSRIFFFLPTQGCIKKQRLYGKGHNYSIARKDPELLVI